MPVEAAKGPSSGIGAYGSIGALLFLCGSCGLAPSNLGRRARPRHYPVSGAPPPSVRAGRANSPGPASSDSQPRPRQPLQLRPQALDPCPVRTQPRCGGNLRRSQRTVGIRYHLQQVPVGLRQHRRLKARLLRRHRHHPDRRISSRPARRLLRLAGRPVRQLRMAGRFFQHPDDVLPGDHQPRDLLLGPRQIPRQLLHPAAQLVRFGRAAASRRLSSSIREPIHRLLAPAQDGRRPR